MILSLLIEIIDLLELKCISDLDEIGLCNKDVLIVIRSIYLFLCIDLVLVAI